VNFLELIENKLSLTFYKNFLFKDLLTIITGALSKMAEAKDPETGYHILRMSTYTQLIAKRLKEKGLFQEEIDDEFIENILISAPMHDIGKVSIPDNVLLKPGKLDDDEWKIMKSHAGAGGLILQKLHKKFTNYNINYFKMAADIAYAHHEKWDGSGYPRSLKEEDIPLASRIAAVADVFDALMSKRPYKKAFSLEKSYSIVKEGIGTHFDPRVVEAFNEIRDEVERVYKQFSEE
jgi:response regulator RpfG family c-di-GMP phosphodiesterase